MAIAPVLSSTPCDGKTSATPAITSSSPAAFFVSRFDSAIKAPSAPPIRDFALSPFAGCSALRASAYSEWGGRP